MWTDARYYLQAEKQLEAGWKMQKMEPGVTTYFDWLASNLVAGQKIDFSWYEIQILIIYRLAAYNLRSKFFKEKGVELVTVPGNLVDLVWAEQKPPMP